MRISRSGRICWEPLEPRLLLSTFHTAQSSAEAAPTSQAVRSYRNSDRHNRHQASTPNSGESAAVPAITAATGIVVGRYIFYNDSVFDGFDPAASAADDAAIATDKRPLLPGGLGQFANITSTPAGITGIMIDISGAQGALNAADFAFSVGNSGTPGQWPAAPLPSGFLVRPGAGTGGSTRVEFTWAAGSIVNEWLSITVMADGNTALATPDVFYWGNLAGFVTGAATTGNYLVKAKDQQLVAADLHGYLNPATITNPHDFNRDGLVDATDELIARDSTANHYTLFPLDLSGIAWSGPLVITSGGTYSGN